MSELTLSGQATAEQIEKWKKEVAEKYGKSCKVWAYEAEGKVGYLRSVDRNTYSAALSKVSTAGIGAFNQEVVRQIWLGGYEEIKTNDSFYFGLVEFIEELMAKKKGTLTEV
jgi:4-aminobutyrate aminotransferase-like enzyme